MTHQELIEKLKDDIRFAESNNDYSDRTSNTYSDGYISGLKTAIRYIEQLAKAEQKALAAHREMFGGE